MPVNLLAVCRANEGLSVKRVSVTADVQNLLEGVFVQQEQQFLQGITEEIAFDGGWTPEENELLKVPATPQVVSVFHQATAGAVGLPVLNAAAIEGESIRALGVILEGVGGPRLLLQNFDARQVLQRHFALFLDGDTFNHLTAPAFSIASGLAGMVVDGEVKFRRFSKIRQIFDLKHLYIEATDAQVDAFTSHDSLTVDNAAAFKAGADQGIRKLINAISHRGTLDAFSTHEICSAAEEEGLHIDRVGDKIVLPMTRANAKRILHFLDDGLL